MGAVAGACGGGEEGVGAGMYVVVGGAGVGAGCEEGEGTGATPSIGSGATCARPDAE